MEKILIEIKNNYLQIFTMSSTAQINNNLLNTNIISNNQLLFSLEYIKKNMKMINSFLKEICLEKNITIVYVNLIKLIPLVCVILNKSTINTLISLEEQNFTYEAYEYIIKNKNIKKVNCYSIPNFMLELFDQKNIMVESRAEVLFTSRFMQENNLNQYSKIYYKMAIRFTSPLNDNDLMDFEVFCKINKYLKTIHFNSYQLNDIDKVLKILGKLRSRNIKIIIHDNISDKESVEILKKYNKQYKKNKIVLRLSYSKEYIKENYLKQIIVTTLIYCLVIILSLIFMSLSYVFISNRTSAKNVKNIREKINNTLNNVVKEPLITTPESDGWQPDEDIDIYSTIKNKELESLLSINKDTVGWLKVPGTNIDYPVVQTTDNNYYLRHNFEKKYDYSGWVFMNYYNSYKNLDKNTVIFAHNRFDSGLMFGTLSNTLNEDWYNNASNNLITFNTLYENLTYEVFAIYKINVTADYMKATFNTDYEWYQFIKMIRDRSIYKSNINVGSNDKILTLSTCSDKNQRLVVHAVLRKV